MRVFYFDWHTIADSGNVSLLLVPLNGSFSCIKHNVALCYTNSARLNNRTHSSTSKLPFYYENISPRRCGFLAPKELQIFLHISIWNRCPEIAPQSERIEWYFFSGENSFCHSQRRENRETQTKPSVHVLMPDSKQAYLPNNMITCTHTQNKCYQNQKENCPRISVKINVS